MKHAPRGPRFYPVVATLVALCLVALPISWFQWSPYFQSLLSALIVLGALPFLGHGKKTPEAPTEASPLDVEQIRDESLDHHFLFNSLATIRYVVKEDPDRARSLILDLSEFLKAKLSAATHHPFHLECALSRAYLKLEEARMEERLRTSWQVEESTRDFEIPIALCQGYLAELISQQIRPHTEGGELHFRAFEEDSKLIIEIVTDRALPQPSAQLTSLFATAEVKLSRQGSKARLELS